MATYDAESGTGGLDASIQYLDEQTRPEVHQHPLLRFVAHVRRRNLTEHGYFLQQHS
jgi:hypothetical protein